MIQRGLRIRLLSAFFALCSACSVFAIEPKEWTIAVFINADNDLDPFGVIDQDEMAKVGSNEHINVVTMIDRRNGPATRNYIEKDKITQLENVGEVDMGDYKQITAFADWAITNYPAKKYAVIVWNHGSGWKVKGNRAPVKSISIDETSGTRISTAQLGTAFKEIKEQLGRKLDVFIMDACLMQMAEVVYVLKDSVDFIVASEDIMPGKGSPYDEILKAVTVQMTPEELSVAWVKIFAASYNNGCQGKEPCTISALRTSDLPDVFDAVNGFCKASMAADFSSAFDNALTDVQKFDCPGNIDLMHFTRLLQSSIDDEGFQTAAKKLIAACSKAVITNSFVPPFTDKAEGLAVFFPVHAYDVNQQYKDLDFAKNTLWDEMILDFYAKFQPYKSIEPMILAAKDGNFTHLDEYLDTLKLKSSDARNVQDMLTKLNFALFAENSFSEKQTAGIASRISKLVEKNALRTSAVRRTDTLATKAWESGYIMDVVSEETITVKRIATGETYTLESREFSTDWAKPFIGRNISMEFGHVCCRMIDPAGNHHDFWTTSIQ